MKMVVKIPVWTMTEELEIELDIEDYDAVSRDRNSELIVPVLAELERQLGFNPNRIQVFNSNGDAIHDASGSPLHQVQLWFDPSYNGFKLPQAKEGILVIFL